MAQKLFRPIRWWLVALLVGAFLVLFHYFPQLKQPRFFKSYFLLLLLMLPAIYVQVIVHELGHLALGRLVGYQLSSFRVFSLSYERGPSGFTLQRRKAQGYGGLCLMIPPVRGATRAQSLLFYTGGILANLLSFVLVRLWLWNAPPHNVLASYFLVALGVMGLMLGVLNLVPFTTRGHIRSDGSHIFGAISNSDQYRLNARISRIGGQLRDGVRPALLTNIPALLAGQIPDRSTRATLLVYGFYYHLDRRETALALNHLDEAELLMGYYPKAFLPGLKAEIMYAACALRQDEAKASALYGELSGELEKDPGVSDYRYTAAYCWYILQDHSTASVALEKGREAARKHQLKGLVPFELQLLEGIAQDMQ